MDNTIRFIRPIRLNMQPCQWAILLAAWFALALSARAQAPSLTIETTADSQVQLSWPADATGYVLEQATRLGDNMNWTEVSTVPTVDNARNIVTIAIDASARYFRLRGVAAPKLATISRTSPANGESGVSVTRETILDFSEPLAETAILTSKVFYSTFGDRRLLSRAELASDRRRATLFYLEPIPAGARVTVSFVGDTVLDAHGQAVDADHNGVPGGTAVIAFETMSTAAIPGTAVIGHIFASEPMAAGGGFTNRPLEGVIVTVDGAEQTLRATTDADGFFELEPCPAGRFFVHIDGRTAVGSDWPNGAYYPVVGKTFEAVAGHTNNLAGGTGEIFLPLVKANTLQQVSATQPTTITFPAEVIAQNPALDGVTLTVPPNALFDDAGNRGGMVGIAPVAPDRIPSPLPPGLEFPLVFTIQTDGPLNFDQPAAVRFPNLPDPVTGEKLPPGAKSALWSYNHDTGRWEVQGSMTVTADGNFVESDPGVGIRQPGWHASSPGSTGGGGGAGGPGPCQAEADAVQDAFMGCMQGAFLELLELSPGVGCAVSIGQAVVSTVQDCTDPTQNCWGSLAYNGLFGGLGCIPGVGTVAGYAQCAYELKTATDAMQACQTAQSGMPALASPEPRRHQPRPAGDDVGALQTLLLESLRESVLAVAGSPAWLEAAAADNAGFTAFGNALVAALDPASEAAARISATERDTLLALPAPNGLPLATVTALLDRFDRFAQGGMTPAEKTAIEQAATALQDTANAAQAAGWETMLDGVFAQLAEITRKNDEGFRGTAGDTGGPAQASLKSGADNLTGYGPLRSTELLYHLVDLRTGFVRRGRSSPNGQLDNVIMGVDTPYLLTYLDPATLQLGTVYFRSGGAGERFTLPIALLTTVNGADSDQDGLSDILEEIVGTSPDAVDTDNDGASDLVEVQQGQNPLDGLALPQGVVANLPLGGSTTGASREAVALGLHVDGARVFVANGKRGLAVVDATDPLRPLWEGELDLPGESFDVSYSPEAQVVALVASPEQFIPGERGLLHLVDVANPAAPRLKLSYSLPGAAVDAWNGRFFVALGNFSAKEVRIYDAASALEIGAFATQNFPTGLRVIGGRAYVTTLSALEVFDVTQPQPTRLGQLAGDFTPELLGRTHLVLDGTTLYVSKTRGVVTIDVSNPAAPAFIGVPPNTTGAARSLALSGGPRMVALTVGTPTGNPSATASVSIYDASDPANTTTFLFGIGTPGRPRNVAMLGGFAAVADDSRGLTIVNFADADLARQGPAITWDSSALDIDPATAGVQVKAGALLELSPRVRDDVHLTRVELLVDGAPVVTRTTYPTVFRFDLPAPAVPGGTVTLQFHATDGSGNATTSEAVALELVADAEPPVLIASLPAANGAAFVNHPFVLQFSEPVDALPVDTAKVRLVSLGADAAPGGGDDVEIAFTEATTSGPAVLIVDFASPLAEGRYQLALDPGAVKDRSANALAQAHTLTFDLVAASPGTAVWITDADANWNSPSNWLNGRLPAQDDDVLIQRSAHRRS